MKKFAYMAVFSLALAGAGTAGIAAWSIGQPEPKMTHNGDVGRGAYLARMAGCIACHTNVEDGGAPLAGGLDLNTEFGTFYSPNLTTDSEHGIGDWSIEEFSTAVRQGVSPEGDPYYPAFPYTFYSSLSDQDIADLWAAFQTVPPVAEPSKLQDMAFPFNFRSGLKLWRAAFFQEETFEAMPDKSDLWNRGKYIVEGPAHCAACHTPRNFAGARKVELEFHGATGLPGGGKSPAITSEALRANGWTHSAIQYALKSGVTPDGDTFGGTMGEVVRDGTSFLSDADLTAIATYLLDEDPT